MGKYTKIFLIANVIIFILSYLLDRGGYHVIDSFALHNFSDKNFSIFQFLTYMFFHASVAHLVFNMIILIFFGSIVEKSVGEHFANYYLLCGVLGGLAHILFFSDPVIGASTAMWGILTTFAYVYPNDKIYLYFLFPVKAKYIISIFLLYEIFSAIVFSNDGISHVGHIGGAIGGIIFYLLLKDKSSPSNF